MVVGGTAGLPVLESSVEIMVQEKWSNVASLPSPRFIQTAATLGNSVSVFGKKFVLFLFLHSCLLSVYSMQVESKIIQILLLMTRFSPTTQL